MPGSCFSRLNVLFKVSKITVTCPKLVKINNRVTLDLPKVSKMTFNLKLLKVSKFTSLKIFSHGKARNIKFG